MGPDARATAGRPATAAQDNADIAGSAPLKA
jgi:hypothetical protein